MLFFFIVTLSYSQKEQHSFFYYTNSGQYDLARNIANKQTDNLLKKEYLKLIDILQLGNFESISTKKIETSINESVLSAIKIINQGLKEYLKNGNSITAYNLFKQSLAISEKTKSNELICLNSQFILEIYSRKHVRSNDISYKYIIDNYKKNAKTKADLDKAEYYDFLITLRHFYKEPKTIEKAYNKTNEYFKNKKMTLIKALHFISNSSYNTLITKKLDSSLYYINKANSFLKEKNGYFEKANISQINLNLGVINFKQNKYKKALKYLKIALNKNDDAIFKNINSSVLYWKHRTYSALDDKLNSLKYHNQFLEQELTLNQSNNLQQISEYETKYETEKKQKENLELKIDIEKEKRQKRNLLLSTIITILVGGIITFLIQKRAKDRQLIAEQEKAIEKQKVTTLLKDQEINSINAMIEGQEIERQSIANDLHDDLGSLMATLRLHFDMLKNKQTDDLYSKTNILIDDAYSKIRSIAHAKNSGVIAKQGLLKAVNNMANKISTASNIDIEVSAFGLESRLENSLEITIFRIIQELTTNIIKHANATYANINLTNHEGSLNIMIEDNGQGFDTSKVIKTNNMGLHSIEKRVEHIEGNVTIESIANKGTTIIIDIPL